MKNKRVKSPSGPATHEDAIRRLTRRLAAMLTLKRSLAFITIWCFVWGAGALVLRAVGGAPRKPLLWGAIGLLVAFVAAFVISRKHLPSESSVRALLDRQNECGGLLMAARDVALGDWQTRMPEIKVPHVRWRGSKSVSLLAASIVFVIASLLVPVRFAAIDAGRGLDVRREVNDLAEKIETLKEEQIIEEARAEAMEQKLDQLRVEASGEDPVKTWEALDHLSGAVERAAIEAAQSAMVNQEKLAQAEALSEGLISGSDKMDSKLMTEAMQTLSEMMKRAMEENQMLARELSAELKEAIKSGALKPEHLKDISKALSQNRAVSNQKLSKLNKAGMIDSNSLKGGALSNRRDNSGLAQFLKENAERMSVEDAVGAWCENPGKGGVNRGRADAAMTWTDGTSERDAKFKEKELPPSAIGGLKDSQLVGISASEPGVENTIAAHGALNDAAKGGGSAYTQTIFPRHRGAVKRYFERK
ncbi:MAG: hypothetical protein L0220_30575 [Acidobacteria bacterium]|nr:hypothetical protein [Acidobacteriota bacterium]